MTEPAIRIRGARQNNLVGVDVDIPRNRLVAITGVSGSGKSSLAFDTLFREGQRRFLETLSAYARQFLGRMEKPDVDHVEGLSPAIAVDQRSIQRGPRSTVGTLTEIVDHLRVLFARAGTARCPEHGEPLASQTPEAVLLQVQQLFAGQAIHVLAPRIRDRKGAHKQLLEDLQRKGYVRVRVDGTVSRIEEVPELARYERHRIEVVVDRLKVTDESEARLREALTTAIDLGDGDVIVLGKEQEHSYSTLRTCAVCGREAPPLEPRLFSFNSPHGACPTCDGMGIFKRPSAERLVPDPTRTVRQGALAVTRASGGALNFPRASFRFLEAIGEAHGFDLDTPWEELTDAARRLLLYGAGEERFEDQASWNGARYQGSVTWNRRYKGVLPSLEDAWRKGTRKKQVERYLDESPCPDCDGSRIHEYARAVTIGGATGAGGAVLPELNRLPVSELPERLAALQLTKREGEIARDLLKEIGRRVEFLLRVGLGYLSLDRAADTLSSGEAQRIRLAAQLGAGLQGVLYVLDEPSIGLHPRDHGRLLDALGDLRDAGNTVVVVEHDEATLRAADTLIDVGPGAGRHGGRIVASGSPEDVGRADSPTGRMLRGELEMPVPDAPRPGNGHQLVVRGARGFNLKGIDAAFPLGALTVVTGVSGSGKSTLVQTTLRRVLARHLGLEAPLPAPHAAVEGLEHVENLVAIDAAPIGRTPRSNPATYSGAFTPIRDLFASLPEARMRGWAPGRFSFNVAGGRCETCLGAGALQVELQFLAPVTVPCEECGGHRFQPETLDVHYKGASIADVLAMTIEEAAEFFRDHPKIARPLSTLVEVGLAYLTLGQPSTTISGGEAQRVKLAKHLQKKGRKHTLYLLDEPTTGLHQADVQRLVAALQRLVDLGHSCIVIEHNLDVVRAADHVIDLGPEGGAEGGTVVAQGTPEAVRAVKSSHTGAALREHERHGVRGQGAGQGKRAAARKVRKKAHLAPRTEIEVVGARTHNLAELSVKIPLGSLTVITGPSGSGKSSLALDTIHAAGQQRFVESLSTYARQFLAARDKPPVDRIDGLQPSISVEARTSLGHPRSTLATTTEIHDHLRVLWARAGVRRCPEHGEKLERGDAGLVARRLIAALDGQRGWIAAPVFGPRDSGAEAPADLPAAVAEAVTEWRAAGFARVLVEGAEVRLEGAVAAVTKACAAADKAAQKANRKGADEEHSPSVPRVDLVVDRLVFDAGSRARIAEAVEQAEALAGGRVSALVKARSGSSPGSKSAPGERLEFSTHGACPVCGFRLKEKLEPRHFSFNTHAGACPDCHGLGQSWQCDPDLLVKRPDLPLVITADGEGTAIPGKLGRYLTKGKGYYEHLLRAVARSHRIDVEKPFAKLTDAQRELILFGTGAREEYRVSIEKQGASFELEENFKAPWPGLCGHVDAWHAKSEDPEWSSVLEKSMARRACPACAGERLAPGPRAVTVGVRRLPELLSQTVGESLAWLGKLRLAKSAREAVEPVVEELAGRLELLDKVGLDYLTLDRSMSTLSGGEARRVRLSASLGSHLVGVCYVLDEPTVGLHPADIDRLTDALMELRDGGNTVLVVEHDESLMERADHIVDLGPGAGKLGGRVVAQGTPAEVRAHADSLTGKALRGEFDLAELRRDPKSLPAKPERVGVRGAKLHNLRGIDFEAAFGQLTGVCGPSGSGKSTLILDTLVPALRGERPKGRWMRSLGASGGNAGRRVVVVDAAPLGRTPASIPATAVGVMDPLRELFARTTEARAQGLTPSSFSFNSTRGRCPACDGRGATKVEMQFLADLWLTCEECDGKRYRPEVLAVRFRGHTIADVLAMPSEEARAFLEHQPVLAKALGVLCDVGLGYLSLGQSSTTLSVGEAQRVKLAAELLRAEGGAKSIVVLDEPSTGLHASDVVHLGRVLRRLVDRGDAVILIEHHTGLLTACDRLVELGPAGGAAGGRLIAEGTPAELARDPHSITGPWLDLGGGSAKRSRTSGPARSKTARKTARKADGKTPGMTPGKPAKSPTRRTKRGSSKSSTEIAS